MVEPTDRTLSDMGMERVRRGRCQIPRPRFRIGQRVRVGLARLRGKAWPDPLTITAIRIDPETRFVEITAVTDADMMQGKLVSVEALLEEDLVPYGPEDNRTDVLIEMLGGNCPVQAEGSVDGIEWYFRARGESWSFQLGSKVPVDDPIWYYEQDYGDQPFAAGWMSEAEAEEFILLAISKWRSGDAELSG